MIDKSRRQFFAGLSALVGAGAVAAIPAPPNRDEFNYREWNVRWSGWKPVVNQHIQVGYWIAQHPKQERFWYSTVGGVVYHAHRYDVLDTTCDHRAGWEYPTPFAPQDELDSIKERARKHLLADAEFNASL